MASYNVPYRILLVDDDIEFLAYVAALSERYNVNFEVCHNLQEAKQKNLFVYDAYIIDLNLTDGSGLELIQQIRKEKGIQSPIAAISGVYRDETTFALLKDGYAIDYILDKPIYPQEFDKLLLRLCAPKSEESPDNMQAMLEKLGREYRKKISEKIKILTEMVREIQKKNDRDSLIGLKNVVHKIAGSAGSYGFSEVSQLCKKLEYRLNKHLEGEKAFDKEGISSLDDFLRHIKFCFQFPDDEKQESEVVLPPILERSPVFIVDSDIGLLELLHREKEEFFLDILTESNPEKALERLRLPEFNPRVVVVAQTFFGSAVKAFDLIKAVQAKPGSIATVFCVILEEDSIENRISTIQQGVKFIFNRAISARMLLATMAEILEAELSRNYKALILDDDVDVCRFMISSLAEIGIESKMTNNPLHLYKVLEEYSPDILFLDINFPDYSGFDLLKILRADIVYRNLIIIMITGYVNLDSQLSSYAENADEILYKPIDKNVLQKCALNIIKKKQALVVSNEQNRMGLKSSKLLVQKIEDALSMAPSFSFSLVFVRIENYSNLVMVEGQNSINQAMVFMSNRLQSQEDKTMSSYVVDNSTFAFLYNGYDENDIENKVFDLLNNFQLQSKLKMNFICSITFLSKNLGNSHQIIKIAEQGLKEAAKKEPGAIKIAAYAMEKGDSLKKTLVLIESNEDLLLILKTAFEAQNLTVRTFSEGKMALEELLSYREGQLPSLVILERRLPDMDGIEILKRLHAHFKVSVPFYFLTDFAAEKDVSEGLKYGALEYIIKPFNLSHLLQKSLNVIFSPQSYQSLFLG